MLGPVSKANRAGLAVKLISRFRMHNNRIKFKEEQIRKLAHSLAADSELKKT